MQRKDCFCVCMYVVLLFFFPKYVKDLGKVDVKKTER